jgi:hypothetical protein
VQPGRRRQHPPTTFRAAPALDVARPPGAAGSGRLPG